MTAIQSLALSLDNHDLVESVAIDGDQLEIRRVGDLPDVKILVVESGTIGVEDVVALVQSVSLNGIVSASLDGGYEWPARSAANAKGLAVLSRRELWGALNVPRLDYYDTNSAKYFKERIGTHHAVKELIREGSDLFRVERKNHESLLVFCADEYVLSQTNVRSILQQHPDVDVISNLSAWNKYTPLAAKEAKSFQSRVFDLSGIYGALNLPLARIAEYVPSQDR